MAGRILNRRELRQQAEQAEQAEPVAAAAPKAAAKKAPAAPRVKKPRPKKAPARFRARWGLFDAGMKQVAIFDYNQREAADRKRDDLNAKNKGTYFLQIVKELMPEAVATPSA
jgi:hypothetical protein